MLGWAALRRATRERAVAVSGLQFTPVFRQVPEGYIGFVEELPGANTQGATLEEARANLQEAVAMILVANRELAQQATGKGPVIREPLKVSA
jgi:predicted RNase H-like HicB family nuclease